MAFAVTSYSEAPFSAENPNVIAFAPSFELTAQQNSVVAKADVVAFPTGQSLTPIAGTANGSAFVQIDLIGSDLSIDLGDTSESFTDADADVTGQELTIVNKSFFQDTLLSFSEAPFATQNSDLISPSNIVIVSNNADVTPISFNLSANLGTATLLAATEGFATGFDLTMQENDPDSVTGDANISLTAFSLGVNLGTVVLDALTPASVTGFDLNMQEGQVEVDDALAIVAGIEMTIAEGSVEHVIWNPVS